MPLNFDWHALQAQLRFDNLTRDVLRKRLDFDDFKRLDFRETLPR